MRRAGARHPPARSRRLGIPEAPLDILAQQIVAACAADEWDEDELFALVTARLSVSESYRARFDAIIDMLSEGIAARRGRYGAYLHRDQVNGRLRARRGSRLAAITSGGAIPGNALYTVVAMPEGTWSAPWTRISPSKAMPATSCSWATPPGAFAAIEALPGACSWKTLTALRPAFRSGSAKLRRAPRADRAVADPQLAANSRRTSAGERRSTPTPIQACVSRQRPDVRSRHRVAEAECGLDDAAAEQAVEYVVAGRSRARRGSHADAPSSPSASSTKAAACNW